MFRFGCVNIESWKLKSFCKMPGRNLKIWKLKCLNLDMWMLKVENWNLKSPCKMSGRNLKIWKLKCLNIENWKLKCLNNENWKLNCLNIENKKTEMSKYWKLNFRNISLEIEIFTWNVWKFKLHLTSITKEL